MAPAGGRPLDLAALDRPAAVPSYIIKIYAIRSLLGPLGFVNQALIAPGLLDRPSTALLFNQRAVLITMVLIYLPFAILPIFLSLERVPRGLLAASADLGATGWQTFRLVVLPLSLPGTIVGGLFAFVLAMGDFVTPQMVGGTDRLYLWPRRCKASSAWPSIGRSARHSPSSSGRRPFGHRPGRVGPAPEPRDKRRRTLARLAPGLFTALVLLALYAPVVLVMLFSVVPYRQGT